MPTESLKSILDRDLSKAEAKEIIEIVSPFLQEIVNYSTNALARCVTSTSGRIDEDLAPLVLYRHIIEMTDGIETLISQSVTTPAIPLLRSSFEAYLSIEYILEREKDYIHRSLSWLVGYIHKRIDAHERFDPSTTKGQQYRIDLNNDKHMSGATVMSQQDAQSAIAQYRSMLARPHLQPIEAEFSRYNNPNWYRLFGGPSNLEQLARHLKLGGGYSVLYRLWSTTIHAQDLLPAIETTDQGDTAITRIRDSSKIKEIANHAATYTLEATRLVLRKFRPGETDFARWYKREIEPTFLATAGIATGR